MPFWQFFNLTYTNAEFSVRWIQIILCSKYTGRKNDKSHPCAQFRYIQNLPKSLEEAWSQGSNSVHLRLFWRTIKNSVSSTVCKDWVDSMGFSGRVLASRKKLWSTPDFCLIRCLDRTFSIKAWAVMSFEGNLTTVKKK